MLNLAVTTEEKVAFLMRPASYSEPAQRVETVETHRSWLFLIDGYAYKLKKPVKTAFLDFSTVELRKHFCEEELRLNRRLAPRVYLDVVPLRAGAERLSIGGEGLEVDWLVKMRRLPGARMLDRAIGEGTFSASEIVRLADRLIAFYRTAPAAPLSPDAYRRRLRCDMLANLDDLQSDPNLPPYGRIERVREALLSFLREAASPIGARASRIVEAHGDLRPEHVALSADPQIIDCLEFNRDLRLLDPLDELAFFALECELLGAPQIGRAVLDRYRDATGDGTLPQLVDLYRACRALLRAKLSIWHLHDPAVRSPERWPGQALRYLRLADTYAERLAAFRSP